jgi:integrase
MWLDPRYADMSFDELARRWLESNPAKKPGSLATDRSNLRAHIVPTLGNRRIGSITQPDVQALVTTWTPHAAPRSVRRWYITVHAVLAYAVSCDWMGRSPCRNIKLPGPKTTKRMSLTAEQINDIADAMDTRYAAMVWLGGITGLRWDEVAGLRARSLDLLRGSLTVAEDGAVSRDAAGRVLSSPKSSAAVRTMAISPDLRVVLAQHMASRGLSAADSEQLLFEAPRGGALRCNNWLRRSGIQRSRKLVARGQDSPTSAEPTPR